MATTVPEESIAAIGREIVDDAKRLVQLELEVAKLQAVSTAKGLAVEIAMFSVAGLFAVFALAYGLLAIPESLGILGHFWGWLASAGVALVIALLIGLIGYRRLRRTINRTKATIEGLKGDVEWARQLPSRRSSSSS